MEKISDNKLDFKKYHRRSIRLKEYDYSQAGAYFVTICTNNWKAFFGNIVNGKMQLNRCGRVVEAEWKRTTKIRKDVKLDVFIMMPNHLHGILLIINDVFVGATRRVAPTACGPMPNSIGAIIGQFKSLVTKRIRKIGLRNFQWQRNYYEHVIRNENELNRIRKYILYNPLLCQYDKENPEYIQDENYDGQWGNFEKMIFAKQKEQTRISVLPSLTGRAGIPV